MLVNRESTSKLPIKRSCCWLTISSAKWKESLTVNSLVVKGFKIGTKNFVIRIIQGRQNKNIVSCDDISIDISIDQFLVLFFFTQHVITCISSRVLMYYIVIDQINKLPEDGLKSLLETSRYIKNTWISREIKIKLYFSYTLLIFYMI